MARLRCFPTIPESPGTLYLVTIPLLNTSAPIRPECMKAALDKWQRLFTVKVIHYSLEACGASMLLYVPSSPLTSAEATARNKDFDQWQLKRWKQENAKLRAKARKINVAFRRRGKPRSHKLSSTQLNSPSDFMKLFKPDLRAMHRFLSRPSDLLPGISKIPVYRRRFTAFVVQHTMLPPVFPLTQMPHIKKNLSLLGFDGDANVCYDFPLHMSQHGFGSEKFLAELEEQCYLLLKARGREPKLWQRFGHKYISQITQEAIDQRLGDLVLREKHEDYPRMWSLLATLDGLIDRLQNPDNILIGVPMPAPRRAQVTLVCLPVTLSLLLTDGFLRWYYKKVKKVEFPHYNYYRRLLPWELHNRTDSQASQLELEMKAE